jgi:hypothetical protein
VGSNFFVIVVGNEAMLAGVHAMTGHLVLRVEPTSGFAAWWGGTEPYIG